MVLIDFILSLVLFCVVIGIFIRLGRIEGILIKMAKHQGAITNEENRKSFGQRFDEAKL